MGVAEFHKAHQAIIGPKMRPQIPRACSIAGGVKSRLHRLAKLALNNGSLAYEFGVKVT